MDDNARNTLLEYARRKRDERRREAALVWDALANGGADDDTVLSIDFVHFGPSREAIDGLATQLSANYTVTPESGPDGYWLLRGTTRPYGTTLSAAAHLAWVDFMCDVADSHGCVFSAWSLTAPRLALAVSSEDVEAEGEEYSPG